MNLIHDTHALIWFLNGDGKLTEKVKAAIEDPNNSTIISIASIWEIAIKISLGKFSFPKGFNIFLNSSNQMAFIHYR